MTRLVAALSLITATALGGEWTHLGGNRYSNGVNEYAVTSDCCGGYRYKIVGPAGPTYSRGNGKYDKVLDFLRDREDREEFRSLLDSLGIKGRQTQYTSYGTQSSGYSVMQQGYIPGLVQSGQTLYGTAGYQAGMPIDVNGLIHEAQRLADRTLVVAQSATAGSSQLVSQAVEGNSKAAQIAASAEVAAAAIQAANPVQTETKVWQTQPAEQPQAERTTETTRYYSARKPGDGVLALFTCAQCHSGPAPKANLNLSLASIRNLSPDQRQDLADRINARINLPPGDPKHMPKGRESLPESARSSLLELILAEPAPANAVQPPQQPYRDDRPPAPPDSPPTPPQALQQGAQNKPLLNMMKQLVQGVMSQSR